MAGKLIGAVGRRRLLVVGILIAVALIIPIGMKGRPWATSGTADVSAEERPGPPIAAKLIAGRAVVVAPSATCRSAPRFEAAVALRLGRGDIIKAADRQSGWTRFKEGAFDCWLPDRLLQFG